MPGAKSDPLQRIIVDAALEIASGVGPDAISMRDLARQANVSHQAPYHHFGDRAGTSPQYARRASQYSAMKCKKIATWAPRHCAKATYVLRSIIEGTSA